MVRSGIDPPPAGDHGAASDDRPLSVVRGHAVLRYWSAPTVVPSEPSTGQQAGARPSRADPGRRGAPGSGLGGSRGRAGLQDRDLGRWLVVRAGELAAGLLPLGEEASLGVEEGEVGVAGRADLGPADRQTKGDRAGLEPDVAGAPDPLDVVDRLDLGRLREERREPGFAEPGEMVGRPCVAAEGGRDRRDQAAGRVVTEPVREPLETRQLDEDDRRRTMEALDPGVLLGQPARPSAGQVEAGGRVQGRPLWRRGLGPVGPARPRCALGKPRGRRVVRPGRSRGRWRREGGWRSGRRSRCRRGSVAGRARPGRRPPRARPTARAGPGSTGSGRRRWR